MCVFLWFLFPICFWSEIPSFGWHTTIHPRGQRGSVCIQNRKCVNISGWAICAPPPHPSYLEAGTAQLWLLGNEDSWSQPPVDTRAHAVMAPVPKCAQLKLLRGWHLSVPRLWKEFCVLCRENFTIPSISFTTCSHKNVMSPSLFGYNQTAGSPAYMLLRDSVIIWPCGLPWPWRSLNKAVFSSWF